MNEPKFDTDETLDTDSDSEYHDGCDPNIFDFDGPDWDEYGNHGFPDIDD